jgi:hypothetical protein
MNWKKFWKTIWKNWRNRVLEQEYCFNIESKIFYLPEIDNSSMAKNSKWKGPIKDLKMIISAILK